MTNAVLLTSTLWLLMQAMPPQTLPTPQVGPLRDTFVVATETVIDDADAADIKADDSHFDGQMQQLKQAQTNLDNMAEDDNEHDIAADAKNLIFVISSCHIQSKDGTPTDKCQAQIADARNRTMTAIGKHKSGSSWVDGPPA